MNFVQGLAMQGGGETAGYDNGPKMCRQPNLQDRLKKAVQQAEEKLAAVKRAAEILAKNPELEELLNIMQRSHF